MWKFQGTAAIAGNNPFWQKKTSHKIEKIRNSAKIYDILIK